MLQNELNGKNCKTALGATPPNPCKIGHFITLKGNVINYPILAFFSKSGLQYSPFYFCNKQETVIEEQITVPENESCVPVSHMKFIIKKVAELLQTQGIPCCECSKTRYILSPLSACIDTVNQYTLNIICPYGKAAYRFELTVTPEEKLAVSLSDETDMTAVKGGV